MGYSHKEIAKAFNTPKPNITRWIKVLGITPAEPWKKYKLPLKLSKEEEQLVIGTLLGDGYMRRGKSRYPALTIGQVSEDYTGFKYKIIQRWASTRPIKRTRKGYVSKADHIWKRGNAYIFNTVSHPVFNNYFNSFYPHGKKRAPSDKLKRLKRLGFFIWFEDDGCFCNRQYIKKDKSITYSAIAQLRTDAFTLNENKQIVKIIKSKFGFDARIYKENRTNNYYLNFNKEDTIKIHNLCAGYGSFFKVKKIKHLEKTK